MKKNPPTGQGLVEYALILALVALVVIAVLSLNGPAVGRVFSNVVSGLGGNVATSNPAGAWIYCAAEGETCSFPGTKNVRYGENGYYYYRTFTNSTPCTNAVFGDPIYGTYKHCYYWDPSAPVP
jgi:Flp pilus assembly pilin Flp